MRGIVVLSVVIVLLHVPILALAQDTSTPTETQTPTPTNTPTPEPAIYMTLPAPEGTPGQMTQINLVMSAGEIHIANLLQWLLYSVWGMFLFAVLVVLARSKK